MQKSRGHITFTGKHEYFALDNGQVYRAPLAGYITTDGYRSGARYEGPSIKWLQTYFAALPEPLFV